MAYDSAPPRAQIFQLRQGPRFSFVVVGAIIRGLIAFCDKAAEKSQLQLWLNHKVGMVKPEIAHHSSRSQEVADKDTRPSQNMENGLGKDENRP